jgi:amino-acid N-acetyltransferase
MTATRVSTPLLAEVRRARTSDVPGIRALVDTYSPERRLLSKATVTLYEDVQEFFVAVDGEQVVGCGALHVMWEDLAEVRTLAVTPSAVGKGVGAALLERLVDNATELGVRRLFCLTFETGFFARHGFVPLEDAVVDPEVQAELLRSSDEGVAEFLDLERVKPNTLGNTRMLRVLHP